MILTPENYHSPEADSEYMSVSLYKQFVGTYGERGCEAAALASCRGEYHKEATPAMLQSSYIDAYFSGTLDSFREKYKGVVFRKSDGELKSEYSHAEKMIARAKQDKMFMKYCGGQTQVIMIGEIGGMKWKCMMDFVHPHILIADLKCMKSLTKLYWVKDLGYIDFVRYYGYDIQMAVYREIYYQNTGELLPCYINGISKEEEPDIRLIRIKDAYLKEAMDSVLQNTPRIKALRETGEYLGVKATRCEICPYCNRTRVITEPIDLDDLVELSNPN